MIADFYPVQVGWVCNTPFDKTKPSKPFTKNGEYEEIKKLDNSKK